MPLNRNFENKVVLVTGSNSGIGRSTVLLFSELGAKVVVTGRNERKNVEVARECEEPLTIVADVSKEEDVDRLMDTVESHFGQLDVLVNNAAIGSGDENDSLEFFDNILKTDLRSVYQLCFRALPLLEKTKGVIVNNSSINGIKPFPNISYCVAKAGMDMLTRCLAINWGPKGIRVNDRHSIWVECMCLNKKQLDDMWKGVDAKYPIRRRGYPEDIAKAIVFLASEDSGFITGTNLKIDGGFLDSPSFDMELTDCLLSKKYVIFPLEKSFELLLKML